MQDLSPFAALTDFVLRPTGSLNSELSIAGTLAQPLLSGQLDLRDGKIALPSLGIFLAGCRGFSYRRSAKASRCAARRVRDPGA